MARFQPGQSGNPGGRHKGLAEVMALARTYTKAAIETLATIMQDEAAPKHARVAAASALLDRGYGKPPQSLEHTGTGTVLQIVTGIPRAPNDPLVIEANESESLH
jgi:uncharacterized protein (UPF0147 family)